MSGTTKEFDPIEYIENSFLDRKKNGKSDVRPVGDAVKFRKTQLSAPRPRRNKATKGASVLDQELKSLL